VVDLVLIPVKSSNVREVGYDPARRDLYIRFKSGPYVYFDVPPTVFEQLLYAAGHGGSVGQYIARAVKPVYQFRKLARLMSALQVQVADTITVQEAGWLGL
jgi:hypothetical protein